MANTLAPPAVETPDLERGELTEIRSQTTAEPPVIASEPKTPAPEHAAAGATSTGPQYGDSSEKLFSVYVHHANEHDKAMVEDWNGDMDSILIFVSE